MQKQIKVSIEGAKPIVEEAHVIAAFLLSARDANIITEDVTLALVDHLRANTKAKVKACVRIVHDK